MTYPTNYLRNALGRFGKSLKITIVLLLLTCSGAFASHIVGMDLSYSWDSGNTYKITLVAYANCASADSGTAYFSLPVDTPKICIYNGSSFISSIMLTPDAANSSIEVTPVCPGYADSTQCSNLASPIPGIKKFTYTGYYTVPSLSTVWRFIFSGYMGTSAAGRAASITNILSGSIISLTDTLNNTLTGHSNSNPALTVLPVPFFCNMEQNNYNPGAVDADGDSLAFQLVAGVNGSGTVACGTGPGFVSYIAPYTPIAPLLASTFAFDPLTGQITFIPNILQRALVVYNIEEYRHGPTGDTLVGTSQREMTFTVLSCSNTSPTAVLDSATGAGSIDDNTHYHICVGSGPFTLSLDPMEPDTSNVINVDTSGVPTGATVVVANNGTNHPHVTISWTSDGVTPTSYPFYFTFIDDNCPLQGQQTIAYSIDISSYSAAAITGADSVYAGATGTLSDVSPGGVWSSSNALVASVDPVSGVVTGIVTGTVTITYTVPACGGATFATTTVTVLPVEGISGNVLFTGIPYYGFVTVYLITYDTATLNLAAVDSVTGYCSGTPAFYYHFTGVPTDSFRVKATNSDASSYSYTGYVPTYHTSNFFWDAADVLYHTSGTADINQDVVMAFGTVAAGPGFIGGNVTTGADKGTSVGVPAVGMLVLALDGTSGAVVQQTYTDISGNYSFTTLATGATYEIYPEALNYATTPYTMISLTTASDSAKNVNFIQHTLVKTITPGTSKVNNIPVLTPSVSVYPNPTKGKLDIVWNELVAESGTVTITDITGRELYRATLNMTKGNGKSGIDISAYPDGLYLLSVRSHSINTNNKIQLAH